MNKIMSILFLMVGCMLFGQEDPAIKLALDDSNVSYKSDGELIFYYMDSVQASYLIVFDQDYEIKHKWIMLFYDLWKSIYIIPVNERTPDIGYTGGSKYKGIMDSEYFEIKNRSNLVTYDSSNIQLMPKFLYKALENHVYTNTITKYIWTESVPVKWVRLKRVNDISVNGRNNVEFSYIISSKNRIIINWISRVLFVEKY